MSRWSGIVLSAEALKSAIKWITNSGIQNSNPDMKRGGGFNSWYDMNSREYPSIFSEITGYGITTLLYLYKMTGNSMFLERAKEAGNWVLRNALYECGAVKIKYFYSKTYDPHSFESGVTCAFDNGMILFGLTNLFKFSNQNKYLEASARIGDFLVEVAQQKNGLFLAVYDTKTGKIMDSSKKWSTQPGSYHAKLSLGLLNLFEITKDKRLKESAERICEQSLEFQETNGRFKIDSNGDTHLHPHCYSAEGLLYAGTKLGIKEFVDSATRATEWALNNQLKNGGIPCALVDGNFVQHERSDVLAQVLRLSLLLRTMNKLDEKYLHKIENLKNRLLQFQHTGPLQEGGFYFGSDLDGKRLDHLNSWCTMFSIQAIDMYRRHLEENEGIGLDLLV